MTAATLFELRPFFTLAHHVPGRIRLTFRPAVLRHPAARELATSAPFPGATRVRVNPAARSVVIEYDAARLAPQAVEAFFAASEPDTARRALDALLG